MSKALRKSAAVAVFAAGLGGCVGTAGVSTWEYQSGPGLETEWVYESWVQGDRSRGLHYEVCTGVFIRQAGASACISETDITSCRLNSPDAF